MSNAMPEREESGTPTDAALVDDTSNRITTMTHNERTINENLQTTAEENANACPFQASAADVISQLRVEAAYLFFADKAPIPIPNELLELAEDEAEHFFEERPRAGSKFLLSEMPPIAPETLAKIEEIVARKWAVPFKYRLTKEVADHNSEVLEAALRLAVLGYYVMPAHRPDPLAGCTASLWHYRKAARDGHAPNAEWVEKQRGRTKYPIGKNWPDRASCDLEAVWLNFNQYPASVWRNGVETDELVTRYINFKVNLAIVTGRKTGTFVVDVDGEEGRDRWRALEAERGVNPRTVQSVTGSEEGDHYFFNLPPGVELRNTSSKFGSAGAEPTGIDIRSYHGVVIVAPSEHKSGGSYRWENTPFVQPQRDPLKWVVGEGFACSPKAQREQAAEQRNSKDATRLIGDDAVPPFNPKTNALPGGLDNRVKQIGYGEGTAGCINNAVFSAGLSLFGMRGWSADTAGLVAMIKERLKAVIAEKPKKAHYLSNDPYVRDRLEQARACARKWEGWVESKPFGYSTRAEAKAAIEAISDEKDDQAEEAAKLVIQCISLGNFDETDRGMFSGLLAKKVCWTATSIKKDLDKAGARIMKGRDPDRETDIVRDLNRTVAQYEGRGKVEIILSNVLPGEMPKRYDASHFKQTLIGSETDKELQKTHAEIWLASEHRRVVDKLDFAPPGAPVLSDRVFNIGRAFRS